MSRDLSLLEPEFRTKVGHALSQCHALGVEMRPFYTVRTVWDQARLWRQSRPIEEIMAAIRNLELKGAPFLAHVLRSVGPQNGPKVTNALPGLSWHQWGEAVDCFWLLNGVAEWSTQKKITLADGQSINGYRLYGTIAVRNGLTSGGFWNDLVDWVHVQKQAKAVLDFHSWPEIDAEMQRRFADTGPALAQTRAIAPAVADNFVKVKDNKFYVGGKEFKFVGFNVRALVHYAAQYAHGPGYTNNSIIHSDAEVQKVQLQMAYGLGARVIRVFLAHNNATPDEIIARLERLLALMREGLGLKDLYLLPAFTNLYGDVPFYVRGDKGEFGGPDYYQPNLTRDWFREGYRTHYLPYVEKVARHFKDDPNIFAWGIGNELKIDRGGFPEAPRVLTGFMHHVARRIKDNDPNHLVTTGMISTAHTWLHWRDDLELRRNLYKAPLNPGNGDHRNIIDFLTIHYPREDVHNAHGLNEGDVDLARDLNMPFIIEEDTVLPGGCHDRRECFRQHLEEWLGAGNSFGRGAGGYMVWGFDGANVPDGDPGGLGGRDAPPDWAPLSNLFSSYSETLRQRLQNFGSQL